MAVAMNVFRVLADVSHALSKCILMWAIHWNRNAEGVSLITQAFYALIFCTRYLDLFWVSPLRSMWNFVLKIFYITSSFYILFLMTRVYARSREREKAWKMGAWSLGGSLILAPIMTLIFWRYYNRFLPYEMLRSFSLILESICILPQLLLLRQTNVPTVIDSYYLLALGLYRALYIVNWAEQSVDNETWRPDWVAIIFGVIQTLLYIDFAWVYYTRQRVKLRNGGIVDSDDLRRGWFLQRIFGKHTVGEEEEEEGDDEESAPALNGHDTNSGPLPSRRNGTARSKWGPRGISVSADDGVLASESERQHLAAAGAAEAYEDPVDPDAKMQDPDELARVLDDDDDDDDDAPPPMHTESGVSNGSEWRG